MTKQFLPPLIEIKDPEVPPKDIRLLVRIEDELNYPGDFESFFIQSNHLSIVSHRIVKRKNKPNFLSTRQFDAPLSILPWFVNKFEFFTKMPHEGGLPHGKISTDDLVEGEDIGLTRLMGRLNARGDQGYSLYNYPRKDFDGSGYQSLIISDSYLFQGGFFETWKELANKYENGTL
ncbi:hypothetical protein MKZ42_18610 [Pseudoalteromonas shioyasakiensis]|uniref:Uncharacterized protein n=1 Tax=Pseudoalteromonas shioyasakiensis TaxID=1190813 RepID=A0ABT6U3K6_9GAMM|nr:MULTISPECIES: hypothetical protein [Pseudoalteromonas]MDI4670736.1 hypothetical protein [Pseudoalteromonas shioyasakiensis]MDI4675263.1 hypothetical protein [Pseudoalteromonas shioyasakiensis]MDI4687545.1 hypothetical protein [Pseudoalteromonas shioyasakiensis]MDI4706240.1 hypothetical protein [Pseudoalteromonas shioyasakiensis]NUJ22490.1 hypothetical protein [Pseudoalteromonas sp. 0802]